MLAVSVALAQRAGCWFYFNCLCWCRGFKKSSSDKETYCSQEGMRRKSGLKTIPMISHQQMPLRLNGCNDLTNHYAAPLIVSSRYLCHQYHCQYWSILHSGTSVTPSDRQNLSAAPFFFHFSAYRHRKGGKRLCFRQNENWICFCCVR